MTGYVCRFRWLTILTLLAIAVVLSACSDSPAPTPEPTTTPTDTPTSVPVATEMPEETAPSGTGDADSSSGECAVGLELNPGDRCSYAEFTISIRSDGAAVLDGNIGGIRMGNTVMQGQSMNLNRFRATKEGSTWTIESLP